MRSPMKLTKSRVIAFLVCAVLAFCFIGAASAQSTVLNAGASTAQPVVGTTLTVTITISNVQNLFGIDAILQWNPSVLSLSNVALNVGDAQSNGVLHGTINRDGDNIKAGDLYLNETSVSGSYELIVQSFGQNTPSFTGSGTIANLTFNVESAGSAGLSLETDLADKNTGGTANNIDHQDTASSVTVVAAGSSTSPTPTPSTSGNTTTPGASPTVPEFPNTLLIGILVVVAVASVAVSTKLLKNRANPSLKKPVNI
jgi:hypothetical protein